MSQGQTRVWSWNLRKHKLHASLDSWEKYPNVLKMGENSKINVQNRSILCEWSLKTLPTAHFINFHGNFRIICFKLINFGQKWPQNCSKRHLIPKKVENILSASSWLQKWSKSFNCFQAAGCSWRISMVIFGYFSVIFDWKWLSCKQLIAIDTKI